MKRIFLGVVSLLLLTFAACKTEETVQNVDTGIYDGTDGLELFLTEIKPEKIPWTEEEKEEYQSYLQPEEFEHVFSKEQIEEFRTQKEVAETVTATQAAEDINLAFQLLAYGYGGYAYFGGDEVFLPIRDSILTKLSGVEEIDTTELRNLLWDGLSSVAIDRHLSINVASAASYTSERNYSHTTYFVRDLYFNDPTGIDAQYVKHTIGPDGAITYCLATVSADASTLPTVLTIEGKEHTLEWSAAEPIDRTTKEEDAIFSETSVGAGQLPVVRNYCLQGDEEKLKSFADTGSTYQDAPLLVLDLRGNQGGRDAYSTLWLRNYCGKHISAKALFATKQSNLAYAFSDADSTPTGNWNISLSCDGILWEKDALLFVLVDGNVASSGENFVNMLTLGNHAILVGTNTMGCISFANNLHYYLPNSGIDMYFGKSLCFYDSLENREGIGFSPDLWVEPDDSLDAVVRLCKYYGLIEAKSSLTDLFQK